MSLSPVNLFAENDLNDAAVQKLISYGIPSELIGELSDEELSILLNADTDKKYYYVPEDEKLDPICISEQEAREAIVNKDSRAWESDTTTTSGGYLEQFIYIADSIDYSNRYYVNYRVKWLQAPLNRKIDVWGVTVSNATLCPETVYSTYSYVIDRKYPTSAPQPGWASGTIDLASSTFRFAHGAASQYELINDIIDGVQKVVEPEYEHDILCNKR